MDPILRALKAQGYHTPTPIQRGAIPPALAGRDVLGCAQTGTGKTCAFATPILQRLSKQRKTPGVIRALILTPTRELAIQIHESFLAYGKHLTLRCAVIFGGVGQQPQVDRLKRGVDILVATPGRLLDLHGQGLLDLSRVETFVLDEADRMLDMGFIHDVRRVLKLLPEQKQTLFFSATMPPEVMELVNALLHDYARVAVDPISSPVEVIRQSLYFVDKSNKTKLLAHLIEEQGMDSVLVFSRTKHGANRIANDLIKRGISAAAIHGNKSQTARQQALADFKAGNVRALIATDIAARGIDIDELKWVVNYDLPEVAETYVHRIGRTGRAGHDGSALSFCRADEMDYLKQIEKLLCRKLPVVDGHPFPMAEAPTGVDPMIQARLEARESAKAARAECSQRAAEKAAAKAERDRKIEKAAAPVPQKEPVKAAESPTPAPETTPTAGKKRKKRKKAAPSVETPKPELPATAPKPETPKKPVSSAASDQTVKRSARGIRRGDLSATMPTAPSVPTVEFVRPNPLDSDVIMDATARLLAPRKPIYSRPRPEPAPSPKQETKQASRRETRRIGKKEHRHEAIPEVKREVKPEPVREAPKPDRSVGKQKSRHSRGNKSPMPPRHTSSNRQKDSTEQRGSMMKPYYLSDD